MVILQLQLFLDPGERLLGGGEPPGHLLHGD